MHDCDENCASPCPYEGWEKHQTQEYWEVEAERLSYERLMAWDAYLDSVE